MTSIHVHSMSCEKRPFCSRCGTVCRTLVNGWNSRSPGFNVVAMRIDAYTMYEKMHYISNLSFVILICMIVTYQSAEQAYLDAILYMIV